MLKVQVNQAKKDVNKFQMHQVVFFDSEGKEHVRMSIKVGGNKASTNKQMERKAIAYAERCVNSDKNVTSYKFLF